MYIMYEAKTNQIAYGWLFNFLRRQPFHASPSDSYWLIPGTEKEAG